MPSRFPDAVDTLATNHSDTSVPREVITASIINDLADAVNKVEAHVRRGWLDLPGGWNDAWLNAKASSALAPAIVSVIGDSIAQGANASNFLTTSWWAQVRTWLLSTYQHHADFYALGESVSGAPTYPGTPPWVMNTAPASWALAGYADLPLWNGAIVTTAMATFVTPYACTALDIIYANHFVAAGQTFTYTVDGGGVQTVTLAAGNRAPIRIALTGLANTTHTIVINGQSSSNSAVVYGIVTYKNATFGIGFAKLARQGQAAGYFINDAGVSPAKRYLLFQGYTTNSQNDTGFGFPAQPHLAIIALGVNDCGAGGYAPSAVEHSLSRIIGAVRRGRDNCSVLVIAHNNPDGISSDVTSNLFANSLSWPLYVRRLRDIASANNAAFANVHGKWGERGVAYGFQVASNAHPNDAGHTDVANLLKLVL